MGLKKSVASVKFHQNTPDAPEITWETPTQAQNNFGRTVVAGRNHARMIFIIKRSGSEIN
jgi:hypothetical protein